VDGDGTQTQFLNIDYMSARLDVDGDGIVGEERWMEFFEHARSNCVRPFIVVGRLHMVINHRLLMQIQPRAQAMRSR